MPQFFSEYLFPTNLIALVILAFLTTFFLYWLIELIRYWRWLWTEQKQIENKQNVQPLVTARQERDRGSEDNDQKADPENAFSEFCNESSLNKRSPIAKHLKAIFLAGWDETRLEVSELISHTSSELFKRNSLFRSVLAVFIVIGLLGTLFGLADSLTGLSPALKETVANDTSTDNSERMIQALGILLEGIKGALAPSIFGIFFTILGVILYGAYLQFACHPIKAVLERLTLTVWVPQLYPTTSQKLLQTLHESEAQMRSGYQTAAQVGELVENVQGNFSEFNENLKRANAITKPLFDSASQINAAASQINHAADVLSKGFTNSLGQFSQEFAENVTRLTGFQDEIRSLHKEFQNAANQKLDQQDQKLDDQTQHLINVLNTLKSYEDAYIKSREQIDETLQKFINEATEANTSIHERNREWFEELNTDISQRNREWFEELNTDNRERYSELQGQLNEELTKLQQTMENELTTISDTLTRNLTNVQSSLDEKLGTLTDRLENFDTPLKEVVEQSRQSFDKQLEILNNNLSDFDEPLREAVDKIRGTFDTQLETLNNRLEDFDEPLKQTAENMSGTFANLVRYMQDIIGDLQKEINKQNKDYEEQLTSVKKLNARVETLLTQLDESSKNQKDAVDGLSTNVNGLTTDIKNLDNAINTFTSDAGTLSQSIETIEKHAETLAEASQQFVEKVEKADVTPLTTGIEELNNSIKEISGHSRTFAKAVNTLGKQQNSSRTEQKPKDPQEKTVKPEPKPNPSFWGRARNMFTRKKTGG